MSRLATVQGSCDPHRLAHHVSHMMEKFMKSGFTPGGQAPDWVPAVDVCETPEAYEIVVELAGVRREDIEVYTERRRLMISGWRRDPMPREKTCLHQIEIEQGRFQRQLSLPGDADEEGVTARYREGLLRIRVAKHGG